LLFSVTIILEIRPTYIIVVTTSSVDAGDDGRGVEAELSLGEENGLVTGIDTPGDEESEDAELPTTGEVDLSVEAVTVDDCGAIHFVQIVETTVFTIVDTVKELSTISFVPEVTVFVTGQVVRVV
jgi:hypothetical protein